MRSGLYCDVHSLLTVPILDIETARSPLWSQYHVSLADQQSVGYYCTLLSHPTKSDFLIDRLGDESISHEVIDKFLHGINRFILKIEPVPNLQVY